MNIIGYYLERLPFAADMGSYEYLILQLPMSPNLECGSLISLNRLYSYNIKEIIMKILYHYSKCCTTFNYYHRKHALKAFIKNK